MFFIFSEIPSPFELSLEREKSYTAGRVAGVN